MQPRPRMNRTKLLLGCSLILSVAGCSITTSHARPGTGATSMQAPEPSAPPLLRDDILSTQAAEALMRKDYEKVLSLTETTGAASAAEAWLTYDRGEALVGLGRTDEALEAYRSAEQRFDRTGNRAGAHKAMWGEARAFSEAGQCEDAGKAYDRYAAAVRPESPRDAELAASYKAFCAPHREW